MLRRAILIPSAVAGAIGLIALLWPKTPAPAGPPRPRMLWMFSAPKPGGAMAAPLVADEAIYFAVVHARGFKLEGAVHALDPATGKPKWTFDPEESMLPTASSPVRANGRLYFGEGMHANFSCRMYCLDAATGKPKWTFPTSDHIEGGATLYRDTIIFPAGNDGVYAIDAATGARRWNFRADLHIDSTPVIEGDHLYVGSGSSRKFPTSQVVCLDAATGNPVWRSPVSLPAWATPAVANGRVYAGLGNGRLTEAAKPPETPAGALACLDAATGASLWTIPVGDAVFGQAVVSGDRVLFGSRDGNLYAVSLEGHELFRVPLGGPVMASLTLAGRSVFAVSVPGRIVCLDTDGRELWRLDLNSGTGETYVYAPIRIRGDHLYVASELRTPGSSVGIVSLTCFEIPGVR
jgi:outer membrane protein assembly factor BamB